MADDSNIAELLSALSPLSAVGIDPDEARLDRAATMARLGLGPDTTPAPWYQAENNIPPQPGASPNGNTLPLGLSRRTVAPSDTPAAAPAPSLAANSGAVPASVSPAEDPGQGPGHFVPASEVPAYKRPTWQDFQRRNAQKGQGPQSQPDLAALNAATVALGQQNYAKLSGDVDTEAGQPSLADATRSLEQQRANYSIPINPNAIDPTTGKALYRPTWAQKLARAGGAFGVNTQCEPLLFAVESVL